MARVEVRLMRFGRAAAVLVSAFAGGSCGETGTDQALGGGGALTGGASAVADGGTAGTDGAGGTQVADVTATVDTTVRRQTMVGFGASIAFFGDFVADRMVPNDDLDQVLFRDLGLDVLRLGNWYQNQTETGTSPNTPFTDTTAAILVRKATLSLGHPPRIIMSSWTPPAYLKSNADTKNGGTLAQPTGAYDYSGFAEWWANALAAYRQAGVVVDYVSLQNEPDFSASWESCLFDATEGIHAGYPEALSALAAALARSTSSPKLLGPETIGVGYGTLDRYLSGLGVSALAGIAHHLYTGGEDGDDPAPDSFLDAMGAAAAAAAPLGKPLFMTEYAPNVPSLLNTAWLIHNAVTVEGVSAYLYWGLTWPPGAPVNWLVTVEDPTKDFSTPKGYTVNDPYYALKHFARWTDEGWVRVEAGSTAAAVKVSAFMAPDGGQVTVVLLNTDHVAHTVAVALGGFAGLVAAGYRSAGTDERTTPFALGTDDLVAMPAESIVTVNFAK
jgi:glucuronoarabinoxylan endo-1,4-beta-xylanase